VGSGSAGVAPEARSSAAKEGHSMPAFSFSPQRIRIAAESLPASSMHGRGNDKAIMTNDELMIGA
jgi:hypothetical protein